MVHVIHNVSRPQPGTVERLAGFTAATVYEAAGRVGFIDPRIKPLAPGVRVAGVVLTVQCHPKDNLMLHKALQIAQPGDVIVADVGGYYDAGYWGGLMTDSALSRKLGGLVIDGCIRDGEEIVEKKFPAFCRGLCMRGTTKAVLGLVNHQIVFGGAIVNPGDLILGDDDGLVVIAQQRIDQVLDAAQRRVDAEIEKSATLLSGTSSVELNKLDKVFESLGLVEE
jgi:4-hydroxy-4-methyl-2-oxoglutarate aldolase